MSARGFKWHPATVYKVENGERQIQLGEAVEVARILDTSIEDMTRESQGQELIALRSDHVKVLYSLRNLRWALDDYLIGREFFATRLGEANEARALLPPDELEQMTKAADPGSKFIGLVRKLYEAIEAPK